MWRWGILLIYYLPSFWRPGMGSEKECVTMFENTSYPIWTKDKWKQESMEILLPFVFPLLWSLVL